MDRDTAENVTMVAYGKSITSIDPIYGHELEKFGTYFCIISSYRNLQNAQIKVSCILLLHMYLKNTLNTIFVSINANLCL